MCKVVCVMSLYSFMEKAEFEKTSGLHLLVQDMKKNSIVSGVVVVGE